MTNREWLDEMSDEELGEFLVNVSCGFYQIGDWGYWLSLERPEQEHVESGRQVSETATDKG